MIFYINYTNNKLFVEPYNNNSSFNDFSEQTKALEKINREYDYLQFKNKKGVFDGNC
jgi:hypothetical protein